MNISINLDVKINANKKKEILSAFRQLEIDAATLGSKYNPSNNKKNYYLVNPGFSLKTNLLEVFEAWNFKIKEDSDFVYIDEYLADQMGDIEHLFGALAHLIEPSCSVTIYGEDDTIKVWTFTKGLMKQEEFEESSCEEEDDEVICAYYENDLNTVISNI